jgi:hypothetical protein
MATPQTALVREATTDRSSIRWSADVGRTPQESMAAQIVLYGAIAEAWRIREPLPLTIEEEEGAYIVSDDVFLIFGTGHNLAEALQDYISALTEYHEVLSRHQDNPTISLFRRLQRFLEHSHA